MGVKWEPVATMVATPAILPVFDDSWKIQCKSCKHLVLETQKDGNEVLRCAEVLTKTGMEKAMWEKRGIDRMYCIDARDSGCGPNATLWEPK